MSALTRQIILSIFGVENVLLTYDIFILSKREKKIYHTSPLTRQVCLTTNHAIRTWYALCLVYTGAARIGLEVLRDNARFYIATTDHNVLFEKLGHLSIVCTPLNLCRSYLSNRFSAVELGGETSDLSKITHGVTQGSILGPLLFLIYVNYIELYNFMRGIP